MNEWMCRMRLLPEVNLVRSSYHVDRNEMNTANSHPSIKILKRITSSNDAAAASDDDVDEGVLRFFQLMIISLIVKVHANIDKRPPTFGMIALEMSSDEKPAIIVYYFLKIL